MTGTLEAQVLPPAEESGAAHEVTDKSSAAKASRSKAKAKKSTSKGSKSSRASSATTEVKASRSGETTSGEAVLKGEESEFVLAPYEVEELSANASATTVEPAVVEPLVVDPPVVEPPMVESVDHEELEQSQSADSQRETTSPRKLSWVALRGWVGKNRLSSILAVALVIAVVFLTLTQLSLNNENSLDSARTSALAAATSYTVDLASYNYRNLNQDFGKVLAESTPTFKQNFAESSEALKTAIVRYHASAVANVVGAGLVSANNSRAVVLVFLNQTVDNTLQKNKPTTENRVEITLLRSGGRWLIDQVTLL
jgi:Mce-associated membrane protein